MIGQLISTTIIFVSFSVALFVPDVYGSFLRIIRVGGGIEISASTLGNKDGPPIVRNGNMLLMTETQLIMMTKETPKILEIPIHDVVGIEYEIHPEWQLPTYNATRQKDFIKIEAYP
jgi:hypothetical protein